MIKKLYLKVSKQKLTRVFGIGLKNLKKLYSKIGLTNKYKKIKYKQLHCIKLKESINKLSYENNLKHHLNYIKEFYVKLKNYRGSRILAKLPLRGQRTKTNAKNARHLNKIYTNAISSNIKRNQKQIKKKK